MSHCCQHGLSVVPTFCEGTSLWYAISFHLACEIANKIHKQCELINTLAATLHKLMVWSHGFFVGLHLWIACFPHVNLCLTPWVVYTCKMSLWETFSPLSKYRYLFNPPSPTLSLQPSGRLASSRWKKNAVVMLIVLQPGKAGHTTPSNSHFLLVVPTPTTLWPCCQAWTPVLW